MRSVRHLVALVVASVALAQDSRPESGPDSGPAASRTESGPASRGRGRGRGRFGRGEGADSRAETRADSRPDEGAASKPVSPFLAIKDGILYPVSSPVVRRGTVLIKDDKIVDVGRDVTIPEGARVIDARGKHVTPGLVSVTVFGTFAGGFTPRGEEKTADQFDPYNQRMLMALSSGITTGCEGALQGGGGFFGGGGRGGGRGLGTPIGQLAGFVGKHAYGSIEGVTVRDTAALLVQYGAGDLLNRGQTRDAVRKAVEYRKKRSDWIAELAAGKKDAKQPPLDDPTKNWVRVLDGELPCLVSSDDRNDLEAVADLSVEFELPLVVLGANEAWTIAPRLARAKLSFILNPRQRDSAGAWNNPAAPHENGWSVENAARLSAAGFRWCVQPLSASVGTGGLMGRDLLQLNMDAAFTVRGGATEEEALAAVTLRPAEILKIADRVGSLEVGKDGDVAIMDLDPLDYRSFAEFTVVNGRVVYEKDKTSFFNHVQTDRSKGLKGSWANER
jgi:hypothetical protein